MHMDHTRGTNLCAKGTIGAFCVIYHRMIIYDMDRIKFACFFTQLAGNTSYAADVLSDAAFIYRAAANHHPHFIGDDLD